VGPERIELLDAGVGTAAEQAEAYRLLGVVNERLGGYRTTFRALDELGIGAGANRLVFVDVAGGDGAFAERLATWSLEHGRRAMAVDLDLNPAALSAARGRDGVASVRGDALQLPLGDGVADCVHASAFFHHLGVEEARDLLSEMCRVSRRLVIVNDLVRSRFAAAAIWLLARILTHNHLVQVDGPLSVRKAFVPDELKAIARAVGATEARDFRWRLERVFPYRMALVGVRIEDAAAREAR
jgi:SAM-dependent methyltransferase